MNQVITWFVLVGFLGVCSIGCFSTTIHSGKSASRREPVANNRSMGVTLWNAVEIEPPYRLDLNCKHGWSEIYIRMTPYDWGLAQLAGGVYQSRTFTLRCAKKAKSSAQPPDTTASSSSPTRSKQAR